MNFLNTKRSWGDICSMLSYYYGDQYKCKINCRAQLQRNKRTPNLRLRRYLQCHLLPVANQPKCDHQIMLEQFNATTVPKRFTNVLVLDPTFVLSSSNQIKFDKVRQLSIRVYHIVLDIQHTLHQMYFISVASKHQWTDISKFATVIQHYQGTVNIPCSEDMTHYRSDGLTIMRSYFE